MEANLNDQGGPGQGRLVLDNNLPPVAADAKRHGSHGPSRRTAAAAATPIASIASANPDPAGQIGPSIGSNATAQRVKCSRTRPASASKRRSQPRTVHTVTPTTCAATRR